MSDLKEHDDFIKTLVNDVTKKILSEIKEYDDVLDLTPNIFVEIHLCVALNTFYFILDNLARCAKKGREQYFINEAIEQTIKAMTEFQKCDRKASFKQGKFVDAN